MAGTSTIGAKGPAGDVSFNYIPLIDVTFNLIIFFVLTSDVQTTAMSRVLVPTVTESMAMPRDKAAGNYILINVLSKALDKRDAPPAEAAEAKSYEVDGKAVDVGNVEALVAVIQQRRAVFEKAARDAGKPFDNFFVEIRADYRVNYGDIRPVMEAVSKAGIERMSLTARTR